ncbi:hypothetical protein KM043_011306 [Ampulex compressa]|nr:hypothetical protein KM043_011306 [Ampulex compressa]
MEGKLVKTCGRGSKTTGLFRGSPRYASLHDRLFAEELITRCLLRPRVPLEQREKERGKRKTILELTHPPTSAAESPETAHSRDSDKTLGESLFSRGGRYARELLTASLSSVLERLYNREFVLAGRLRMTYSSCEIQVSEFTPMV